MSKIHIPYQERLHRQADFKVKYRFYKPSEGGRATLPSQGIRSDFWYESDDHTIDGYFMIWPEFEDNEGNIIRSGSILQEGIARMWIINSALKAYHNERIQIGTKGYFIEGIKTAICEVIEINGDLIKK